MRWNLLQSNRLEPMSWDLKLDSRYPYIWHINVDYDHLFLNIQDFQQEKKTCQSPSRPQESYKQGTYFTPRKCFLSARVHMSMVGYPPPSYICLISREIHWKSNGEYIKIDGYNYRNKRISRFNLVQKILRYKMKHIHLQQASTWELRHPKNTFGK